MDEVRFDENGLILRPDARDGVVRRRAAEMALPEVKRWLGGDAAYYTDTDLIAKLMKHLTRADGFEIAKSMDRDGWNSDSGLVKILDQGFIYDAEREIVSQWVRCLGVKLEIPIGATVEWRGQTGEVVSRDEALAKYGVRMPDQKDGWRHVCNAEEVKLATEVKAA
jgi:hypothetical protein